MRLFSNGCSFLTPRPKDGVETFSSKILAEQYGLNLINLAMGGRGNLRISFSTKVWFEQNSVEDVFAVIGWSSAVRNDYITDDGWKKGRIPGTELTWRSWKTFDNSSFIRNNRGWDIENNLSMNFLEHVFNLQNYFECKRIPYVMYNSLPNDFGSGAIDFEVIKNSINMDRFFNPTVSHLEFVTDNNLIVSPDDPHPSAEGHKQWASQLMEFINANNLRTI
jgi:hypothetical protein